MFYTYDRIKSCDPVFILIKKCLSDNPMKIKKQYPKLLFKSAKANYMAGGPGGFVGGPDGG
jgi:hypothetical protein